MINTIQTCRANTLESPGGIRGDVPANLSKSSPRRHGEQGLPATKMADATHVEHLWAIIQCMGPMEASCVVIYDLDER